ncbi:hypothetical protein, partial [Kosakonia cowanii]|uniref:hypothetical protein n=1 Tax=Kosakonia cowanii TaxID=208223 RepID=UPI0028A16A9B
YGVERFCRPDKAQPPSGKGATGIMLVNGTLPPKPHARFIAGWRVPLIRPTGWSGFVGRIRRSRHPAINARYNVI